MIKSRYELEELVNSHEILNLVDDVNTATAIKDTLFRDGDDSAHSKAAYLAAVKQWARANNRLEEALGKVLA